MALKELVIEMEQMLQKQNYNDNFSFGVTADHRYVFVFLETFLKHQGYDVLKMNLSDLDMMHLFRPDLEVDHTSDTGNIYDQQENNQITFVEDRIKDCLEKSKSLDRPIILFDYMNGLYYRTEEHINQLMKEGTFFTVNRDNDNENNGENQNNSEPNTNSTQIKVPLILSSWSSFDNDIRHRFHEGYCTSIESRYLRHKVLLKELYEKEIEDRRVLYQNLHNEQISRQQASAPYQWAV